MTMHAHPPRTVQELFAMTLSAPVDWPGKTIRLEPDSVLDYRNRSVLPRVSVAELYHENSKLAPHMVTWLAASRVDPAAVRDEFVNRRARVWRSGRFRDVGSPAARRLLRGTAERVPRGLFYAVEVRLACVGGLGLFEPVTGQVRLVKELALTEMERLLTATGIARTGTETEAHETEAALIVGCFPRNELLFGPRGYRRTLMEAGVLTSELCKAAPGEFSVTAHYEFDDYEVDAVAEADGTEESVLAVIELREGDDGRRSAT